MRAVVIKSILVSVVVTVLVTGSSARSFGHEAEESPQASPVAVSVNTRGGEVEDEHFYEGDELRVRVQSFVDADVFVYVVYHQADGASYLIYPNSATPDNCLPAGANRELPGEDHRIVFRIRAPLGRESVQVITATRPLEEMKQLIDEAADALPSVPADILEDWCKKWNTEQSLLAVHDSEFETRPSAAGEQPVDSEAMPEQSSYAAE
jgi:hypothetical protein